MGRQKQGILIGSLIVLVGILTLLMNLDVFPRFGDFMWGIVLLMVALFFFNIYWKNRPQWWALLPTAVFAAIGIGLVLKSLIWLPGEIIGFLLFFLTGGVFAFLYIRDPNEWWPVIPAGALFSLATIVLIDGFRLLDSDYQGVIFLFGLGLTFIYLWSQRTLENKLFWALYPGAVLLILSVLVYTEEARWLGSDYVFPILLIMTGLFFIATSLLKPRKTKATKPKESSKNVEEKKE